MVLEQNHRVFEFHKYSPGKNHSFLLSLKQQAWATDDVAQIYDKCMTELEQHLQSIPHTLAMNPQAQALRSLLEAVVVARNSRDAIAALGLLQKVVLTTLLLSQLT